jgi:hypothetical protein
MGGFMSDESKPAPLQYQIAPSPVTRGQFRLLLLLLLIQVVVSVQSAYAPGFVGWVKQRWAEHQQAVAHRAQVRQNLATMRQCLAHTEPAAKVIWDEDPDRAAGLLAGAGYIPVEIEPPGVPSFISNALRPGAKAVSPGFVPEAANLFRSHSATALVFMHGRRAAGRAQRLVVVTVGATMPIAVDNNPPDQPFDFRVYKVHGFAAASFAYSAEGEAVWDGLNHSKALSIGDDSSGVEMPGHWLPPASPGEPGTLRVDYRDQLRVFAGQPDPADPSHFTIAYDLDGRPGIIDGWLKPDGSVQLEPRVGKRVNAIWYPHAK